MATVTKSIGTSSRDYSTITLWEADLDDDPTYDAGDDAVGECYNDSAFDEAVTIDGGGSINLNSVTLTVASGERHDGTAGSGARIVRTASANETIDFVTDINGNALSWLEIDNNDNAAQQAVHMDNGISARGGSSCHHLLIHNVKAASSTWWCAGLHLEQWDQTNESFAHNNIIYALQTRTNTDLNAALIFQYDGWSVYNTTIHDCINHAGTNRFDGINGHNTQASSQDLQNCIITDIEAENSATCINLTNVTESHNLTSDTSASGTGSLTEKAAADQFVSTTVGSEDLHLKSGADAIDAGTDLGTTPAGVNISIDGRDRDAEGDTWDMGAHEFVPGGVNDIFHGGLITHIIENSILDDADTFNDGDVDLHVLGSLLEDADRLFHGEIAQPEAGVQNIEGPEFQDPDTFFQGDVDLHVLGSILEDADQLFHGTIATVAVGQINVIVPFKRPTFNRPSGVPVLNRASPQADGLVGLWIHSSQGPGGRIPDLSGRGNHFDTYGDVNDVTTVINSEGFAFQFNGQTDQIITTENQVVSAFPLTIMCWCRFGTSAVQNMFGLGDSGSTTNRIGIGHAVTVNSARYWIEGIGVEWSIPNPGQPILLVGVSQAINNHKIYGNGILANTSTLTSSADPANHTRAGIGAFVDSTPSSPVTANGQWWVSAVWNRALNDAEVWSLYDPATRWDLYWKPKLYIPVFSGAAVAAADQNIEGSKFDDTDTFNDGRIDLHLFGSVLTDADTLNDGLITHIIEGSLLSDVDTLNGGDVDYHILGSLLQDADQLFHGEIAVGVSNIEGSLLQDADTFNEGDVDLHLFGSLLQDVDQLFHGLISPTNLFGSLLQDADVFNQGDVDLHILGSILQDADQLFHGEIAQIAGDEQGIEGPEFQDADTFFDGDVDLHILGSLLTDTDTLNQGDIDLHLFGSIFTDADTFNQGDIDLHILGSQLEDADTFFDGFVEPISLSGSLLQDADQFFDGDVDLHLFGSILTDTDTLNDGDVDLHILGSVLTDTDAFNQGDVDLHILGSILEDADTFFDGDVLGVGSLQVIEGSLLQDADTFFDGDIDLHLFGSLLEDADTLNQGDVDQHILGSIVTDTDTLNDGDVDLHILGSLHEDPDNMNNGDTSPQNGFLGFLQDPDIFFGGLVEGGAAPVLAESPKRVAIVKAIVGAGALYDNFDRLHEPYDVSANSTGSVISYESINIDSGL